ncbi:hypothetical protein E0H58_39210 [Kribbella speibonae]|uniref:Uncharacterized protein n=1 Tax=Kribbella speibonae TaxID=1572660 RepID=A0ABY1ZW55_9ACTN|nr:hypothetical protein E0H58_39210 [Kribbella speibonae]
MMLFVLIRFSVLIRETTALASSLTSPKKAREDKNRDYKIGFISAGSALFGAFIGALASLGVTTLQLHADLDKDARAKRAEVYAAFLDVADRYHSQTLETNQTIASLPPDKRARLTGNSPEIAAFLKLRSEFQGQINQVYVYGSDDGWERARELAAWLPDSNMGELEFRDVSESGFSGAYNALLQVFCQEAPAKPRDKCQP